MRGRKADRVNVFGDDGKNELESFTDQIYGESDPGDLNTGRVVARPLPLDDVWADVKQPRRAIPATLRLHWDGNPADVSALLDAWAKVAAVDDAAGILTGSGDGIDMEGLPPVAVNYIELLRLAGDIKRVGLTNPVSVVRQHNGQYVIESGERRLLAYHILHTQFGEKYGRIPAIVVDGKNYVWRQASENTARRSLNAIGMARQLALLIMDSREGIDGVRYDDYETLVVQGGSDRRYYAQVANGNIHRIPKGMGERIQAAMGLSETQLSRYRTLLKLTDDDVVNDALWLRADMEDWSERFVREIADTLPMGKVREVLERPNWTAEDLRGLIERPAATSPMGKVYQVVEIADPEGWTMGTPVQPVTGREVWVWARNAHGAIVPVYRATYRPIDRWTFERVVRTGDNDVLAEVRSGNGAVIYITRDLLVKAAPASPAPARRDSALSVGRYVWVDVDGSPKFGVIRYEREQNDGSKLFGVFKYDGGSTHYYAAEEMTPFEGSLQDVAAEIHKARGTVPAAPAPPNDEAPVPMPPPNLRGEGTPFAAYNDVDDPEGWYPQMRVRTNRRAMVWAMGNNNLYVATGEYVDADTQVTYIKSFSSGQNILALVRTDDGRMRNLLRERLVPIRDNREKPQSQVEQMQRAMSSDNAPSAGSDERVLDPNTTLSRGLFYLIALANIYQREETHDRVKMAINLSQGQAAQMSADDTLGDWIEETHAHVSDLLGDIMGELNDYLNWLGENY